MILKGERVKFHSLSEGNCFVDFGGIEVKEETFNGNIIGMKIIDKLVG